MESINKKNLRIIEAVHKNWKGFYEKKKAQDPVEYPTLESFTAKKLKEIMVSEGHLSV